MRQAVIEKSEHIFAINLRIEAKAEDVLIHQFRYSTSVLSPDFIVVAATNARAIRGERIAELINYERTDKGTCSGDLTGKR